MFGDLFLGNSKKSPKFEQTNKKITRSQTITAKPLYYVQPTSVIFRPNWNISTRTEPKKRFSNLQSRRCLRVCACVYLYTFVYVTALRRTPSNCIKTHTNQPVDSCLIHHVISIHEASRNQFILIFMNILNKQSLYTISCFRVFTESDYR